VAVVYCRSSSPSPNQVTVTSLISSNASFFVGRREAPPFDIPPRGAVTINVGFQPFRPGAPRPPRGDQTATLGIASTDDVHPVQTLRLKGHFDP
jgi:hypothetical protein